MGTETTNEAGKVDDETLAEELRPVAEAAALTPEEVLAAIRAGLRASSSSLPPPVTDYGPVRLELMGHRYREGRLSEVVIAGQPFLRLDLKGGHVEFYAPSSVYCISPGVAPPVPLAAIPQRFGDLLDDDETEADREEYLDYEGASGD